MKAKPIDRIELTRRKFSKQNLHEDFTPGLQECPNCHSKSLKLDGGCMSCLSCGWSACG